jgi:hypothetical protein
MIKIFIGANPTNADAGPSQATGNNGSLVNQQQQQYYQHLHQNQLNLEKEQIHGIVHSNPTIQANLKPNYTTASNQPTKTSQKKFISSQKGISSREYNKRDYGNHRMLNIADNVMSPPSNKVGYGFISATSNTKNSSVGKKKDTHGFDGKRYFLSPGNLF